MSGPIRVVLVDDQALFRAGIRMVIDSQPDLEVVLRHRPELGAALEAVHAGPWEAPDEAYTPDILTTLALA